MTLKKAPDRSRLRATIPRRAVEIVEERSAGGTRLTSKYQLDGDRVGMICWNDDGTTPLLSRGYKNGRPVGWQLEHHFDGSVLFAEYYRYGRVDGWTFQWAVDGQLVARCEFRRGTGIDYWCDPTTGALSEVHPYLAGLPHGCETWWNDDQTTVHIERYWCNGKAHGIEREWNDHGRLARGWPRYFIHGERTDKRRYTRAQHSRRSVQKTNFRTGPCRADSSDFSFMITTTNRDTRGNGRAVGSQQCVAAKLRHPCRKRLPSSFNAGSCCIIFWLVNVLRFVEGRRRPHNPLGGQMHELRSDPQLRR